MVCFYIQRLIRKEPDQSRNGVFKYFQFDYMGSAEFEFGSVPKALKEFQGMKLHSLIEIKDLTTQTSCWFVGPGEQLETAREVFHDQVQDLRSPKYRFKECTYIARAYGRNKFWQDKDDRNERFIGWFSIREEQLFALFRFEDDAKNWVKGLKELVFK